MYFIVAAGLLVTAILVVGVGLIGPRTPDVQVIRPGLAFDHSDLRHVAAVADGVVVATVVSVEDVDQSQGIPRTIYRVGVQQALKGSLSGELRVRQLGGKVGKDEYVLEYSALPEVGKTYIFALRGGPDVYTSLAGPTSPEELSVSLTERSAVRSKWLSAIADQRWPEGYPRG